MYTRPQLGFAPRSRRRPYLIGDADHAPQLGSLTSIIGGLVGGIIGGPAGSAAGSSIGGLVSFSGSQDQQRQQRVNWMVTAAQQGSPLAAAIIIDGPQNVGGNEAPMWTRAQSEIPATVLTQANAQYPGGFWPVGAPFDMPTQRAAIVQQLQSIGVQNPGGGSLAPIGSTVTTSPTAPISQLPTAHLPIVTTVASYNWLPIAAVGVVALIALTGSNRGGSRGRR